MGPAGGSEPEVAQTAAYIRSLTGLAAGMDVHSFGQVFLRNYGRTTAPTAQEPFLAALGDAMAAAASGVRGSQYESIRSGQLYPSSGSLDDWFYDQIGVPGFTLELRDTGEYGFLLPAGQIVPTGQEVVEAVLTLGETLLSAMEKEGPDGLAAGRKIRRIRRAIQAKRTAPRGE